MVGSPFWRIAPLSFALLCIVTSGCEGDGPGAKAEGDATPSEQADGGADVVGGADVGGGGGLCEALAADLAGTCCDLLSQTPPDGGERFGREVLEVTDCDGEPLGTYPCYRASEVPEGGTDERTEGDAVNYDDAEDGADDAARENAACQRVLARLDEEKCEEVGCADDV